jgi:hypothetical protein
MSDENTRPENTRSENTRPENMRQSPDDLRERKLEAGLPVEELRQPDPALQLTTGRLGAAGWAIFAVVAIAILTAVLWGLNGPIETSPQTGSQAGSQPGSKTSAAQNTAAAPNKSPAPSPTASQNGPGAKP